MKLLDNLHKMGILRVGVAGGTYKSSKDMPDELMFDNVYDKEKDFVGGKGTMKAGDGRKPAGKGSGLLFFVLLVVSVVATLFFGFVDFSVSWFFSMLVVLLVFIFKLFDYRRGICSLKMIWIYFFVYIIVTMSILSVGTSRENLSVENLNTSGSQAQTIDETDWIDYAGVKSPIFTFRYPKSYEIQEVGTSTMVYVDRNKDPDYHIVYSVLEGANPPFKDCQQFATIVAAGYEKGELRYAKPRDFFGFTGCEYGINIGQNSDKVYEITYNFSTVDKSFYVTAYAKKLSELDIPSKIMQSFKLK